MSLLQIQIDEKLKKAIQKKAAEYDVPVSSLVKILLTDSFLRKKESQSPKWGNVFSAERDNKGKGISLSSLIKAL
ncbi:MAG: hypothetical protein Q7S47_02010 [bacterium]|nr:hypothetical protein [bacterium]